MQNMKLLAGVIVGTLVLVFGVAFLFSADESEVTEETVFDEELVVGEARRAKEPQESEIEVGRNGEMASESGEVANVITLVEFSDFQCPACKSAEALVGQIMNQYGDRVRLVYRHFPLEAIHRNAKSAAIASEVAAEQGLFWEYHDVLFERQEEWAESGDIEDLLERYAVEVGVSEGAVREGLGNQSYVELVERDMGDGRALGVNSTPTFFLAGEKVYSPDLLDKLEQLL